MICTSVNNCGLSYSAFLFPCSGNALSPFYLLVIVLAWVRSTSESLSGVFLMFDYDYNTMVICILVTYRWFSKLSMTPRVICDTPNMTEIFFLKEFRYVILLSASSQICKIQKLTPMIWSWLIKLWSLLTLQMIVSIQMHCSVIHTSDKNISWSFCIVAVVSMTLQLKLKLHLIRPLVKHIQYQWVIITVFFTSV